jgi:uncharacterized protein YkwD
MVRAVKVPRFVATAAAASAFAVSCLHPAGTEGVPTEIAAPDLSSTLVETYPQAAEPTDPVKAAVFVRINRDRADHGQPSVVWDERASRVADLFCAGQEREGSQGHYLTDGLPPYARMSFGGVFGVDSENSASTLTTGTWAPQNFERLALSAEQRMLAERPPTDGHRRTILDPDVTHVGVGYAGRGGQFRTAQEFLVRRLDRLSISRAAGRSPAVSFEGRVRSPDWIQFVTIAREPVPSPISLREANARSRYSYPAPAEALVPAGRRNLVIEGTLTRDRLRIHRDHGFSFAYAAERPGLFTFVFYVARREGEPPKQAGSASVLFR